MMMPYSTIHTPTTMRKTSSESSGCRRTIAPATMLMTPSTIDRPRSTVCPDAASTRSRTPRNTHQAPITNAIRTTVCKGLRRTRNPRSTANAPEIATSVRVPPEAVTSANERMIWTIPNPNSWIAMTTATTNRVASGHASTAIPSPNVRTPSSTVTPVSTRRALSAVSASVGTTIGVVMTPLGSSVNPAVE